MSLLTHERETFFVSFCTPHACVTVQTLTRWILLLGRLEWILPSGNLMQFAQHLLFITVVTSLCYRFRNLQTGLPQEECSEHFMKNIYDHPAFSVTFTLTDTDSH